MHDKYAVKGEYNCLYLEARDCVALLNLHREFHEYMHLSLIYKELLPSYCVNCPTLKQISGVMIESGEEWIERGKQDDG